MYSDRQTLTDVALQDGVHAIHTGTTVQMLLGKMVCMAYTLENQLQMLLGKMVCMLYIHWRNSYICGALQDDVHAIYTKVAPLMQCKIQCHSK